MSILDPQLLLINHIRQMISLQRLVMGLPAEYDSLSGPVTPMPSSDVPMLDEMFPVREIEHGRYSV